MRDVTSTCMFRMKHLVYVSQDIKNTQKFANQFGKYIFLIFLEFLISYIVSSEETESAKQITIL